MTAMETLDCPWSNWAPATISFCEERLCAWVVEPSNAWSNLAFVAGGAVMLWQSRNLRQPKLSMSY